jgi:hypothetical protein
MAHGKLVNNVQYKVISLLRTTDEKKAKESNKLIIIDCQIDWPLMHSTYN